MIKSINKVPILISFVFFFCCYHSNAQFSFKAQTGIGYIEHFSVGTTFEFAGRHDISLLYGSNVFINMNDFSSFMLSYEYMFRKLEFKGLTPQLGVKGGYAIYSDKYYKWELVALVFTGGLNYQLNNRIGIDMNMGMAYSRELSLKRINYGAIGKYKEYLPEFKLGLSYNL